VDNRELDTDRSKKLLGGSEEYIRTFMCLNRPFPDVANLLFKQWQHEYVLTGNEQIFQVAIGKPPLTVKKLPIRDAVDRLIYYEELDNNQARRNNKWKKFEKENPEARETMVQRLTSQYGDIIIITERDPNIGRFLKKLREDLKIKLYGHVKNQDEMINHLKSIIKACPKLLLLPYELLKDSDEDLGTFDLRSHRIIGQIYEKCLRELNNWLSAQNVTQSMEDLTSYFASMHFENILDGEKKQIQLLRIFYAIEEKAPRNGAHRRVRNNLEHEVHEKQNDPYKVFVSLQTISKT